MITYRVPVVADGRVTERRYRDIETADGALPYARLGLDDDPFAAIAGAALAAGSACVAASGTHAATCSPRAG